MRDDLAAGQVCAVLANLHTSKGGFSPGDFLTEYGPRPEAEPKSDQQLRDLALKLNCLMGGKVKK